MAEGEFHESINLAALWRLPVLFFCENNLYAMGTALARSDSQTNLAIKAASYEVPAWPVDGMDVEAVAARPRRAVEAVRNGGGPHFLELLTYRFRAHSMYDPDRYRDKGEIERWRRATRFATGRSVARGGRARRRGDARGSRTTSPRRSRQLSPSPKPATREPVADLTRFVTSEGGQP